MSRCLKYQLIAYHRCVNAQLFDFQIPNAKLFQTFEGPKNYEKPSNQSHKVLIFNHLQNQRLNQAQDIFNRIQSPNVDLYTMMITGYTRNNQLADALNLFERMPVKDIISWNSMIRGCVRGGDMNTALKLFDEMPKRNVISWTTVVNGYFQFGRVKEAERLFHQMPERDIAAWNSMIHGYLQSGELEKAMRLFEQMPHRNVISWTSMIGGLDQNGKSEEALRLFKNMLDSGVEATSTTYACVMTACANSSAFHLGVQIHGCVVKLGLWFDEFITASLITFYANCRRIKDFCKLFDEKRYKNVVIWTALLSGYSSNSKHTEALQVLASMLKTSVLPNQSTFTSVLNSCSELGALDRGKEIHGVAIKLGLEKDVFVSNSLVVMYTECGNISDAAAVFKKISTKNTVSWNSIIVGCAQHGHGMWALTIFGQMIRFHADPDEITFTGLLSACSHSGFLQKGKSFFKLMNQGNVIQPKIQHYVCMVDILGRSGKLEEAEDMIENMPMEPNSIVWLSLLSACKQHCDLGRAERAAAAVFELDPSSSAPYVLMSNLYASARRWSDVSRMRNEMKKRRVMKSPGISWVVLRGQKHEFKSGDRSHPLSRKIYEKLEFLSWKLKEIGHVPDQRFALHDVEDEQKDQMLWNHSERLAIAFGLISTIEGTTIVVMKNLRVCGDCHSAIKLIAKIVGREIVVRDTSRFHHFKDGLCSCGDYW